MRKRHYLSLFIILLAVVSCKKEQKSSMGSGLLSFSVSGQYSDTQVDNTADLISVVMPHTLKMSSVTVNFTLSDQATATYNDVPVTPGSSINAQGTGIFKVTSGDKRNTTTYRLQAETELQLFGLGATVSAENSLNRTYNYYFDQMDGSTHQTVNCGPTVTTMAIKWADSTFTKTPVDARNTFPESGGWWYTNDINNYLDRFAIDHTTLPFNTGTADGVITYAIDHGNTVILCLDMYYADYNSDLTQHTNKFYYTAAPAWGHFLLVKGYKKVDDKLYYEIYDPNSSNMRYADNTLKGLNRYYLNSDIQLATGNWWQYAIVVARKGQKVVSALRSQSTNSLPQAIPVARGR